MAHLVFFFFSNGSFQIQFLDYLHFSRLKCMVSVARDYYFYHIGSKSLVLLHFNVVLFNICLVLLKSFPPYKKIDLLFGLVV